MKKYEGENTGRQKKVVEKKNRRRKQLEGKILVGKVLAGKSPRGKDQRGKYQRGKDLAPDIDLELVNPGTTFFFTSY